MDEILAFFDETLDSAAIGGMPFYVSELGTEMAKAVAALSKSISYQMNWITDTNSYYSDIKKKLANHILEKWITFKQKEKSETIQKSSVVSMSSFASTAVINQPSDTVYKQYVLYLLKQEPLLLASENYLGQILHNLISMNTPKKLPSLVTKLLTTIKQQDKRQRNTMACILDIQASIMDFNLDRFGAVVFESDDIKERPFDGSITPKDKSYQRLSIQIAQETLNSFPEVIVYRPHCFLRFIGHFAKLRTVDPTKSVEFASFVGTAFKAKLNDKVTAEEYDQYYSLNVSLIENLLKMETYPTFTRRIALEVLILLGNHTKVQLSKTEKIWRSDLLKLLDQFCVDPDSSIRMRALKVDTS